MALQLPRIDLGSSRWGIVFWESPGKRENGELFICYLIRVRVRGDNIIVACKTRGNIHKIIISVKSSYILASKEFSQLIYKISNY